MLAKYLTRQWGFSQNYPYGKFFLQILKFQRSCSCPQRLLISKPLYYFYLQNSAQSILYEHAAAASSPFKLLVTFPLLCLTDTHMHTGEIGMDATFSMLCSTLYPKLLAGPQELHLSKHSWLSCLLEGPCKPRTSTPAAKLVSPSF